MILIAIVLLARSINTDYRMTIDKIEYYHVLHSSI